MKIDMVKYLAVLTAFMALGVANAGEIAKFMQETLAEQRARNAAEEQKATADALKTPEVPEFELPKESIFTSKYKARDARYYKYDKSGRLVSVEYAATPAKNEYYTYDKQGNILEKKLGDKVYKYTYDSANQLLELNSPDGKREYFYDQAGRLVMEKLNGEIDVQYTYGYLDKVIEVDRRGKVTKFAYDGFGMLATKTLSDGTVENWVWDGLALIRRGDDIYVNEPHISGGVPIVSKTKEGVRYHEHDFLGTTLWSMDTKGKVVKDYQDTTIFGEGSIQHDRSARFTGKPYGEDLQAYVFPYRNYDASTARWRTADPAGYPDGINQHFYAAIPTSELDTFGFWKMTVFGVAYSPKTEQTITGDNTTVNVSVEVPLVYFKIERENGDIGKKTFKVSGEVSFNGETWESVSHNFTILAEIQSAQYYTPNLGSKTCQLSIGNHEGTVKLSAPDINSAFGSFTIKVVEK